MKLRLLSITALCLSLVALSACHKDPEETTTSTVYGFPGRNRTVPNPQATPPATTQLPPDQNPDAAAVNATPPPAPTAAPASRKVTGDVPYGIPVPGKPGQVLSPHSPDAGPIDVHGYAPGQEVVDPLTGKSFLVP